ncbi:MAG: M23 family metallopeptidase [Mailhella sp.]|nr:M23 family metallopeptidase [Mailhella sp.]
MNLPRLFPVFLTLLLAAQASAAEYSVPPAVSQGHAFPAAVTDSEPFTASFGWRGEVISVPAERHGSGWKAEILLALPIDAAGSASLTIRHGAASKDFTVRSVPVPWPQSILKVEPKYVVPPKETQERLTREAEESRLAYALRTPRSWSLPFARPVPGGITSPFGGRRVFNGKPRAPHKGTDMRSPEGAPVMAAADGTVVLAGHHYFGGKSVFIDHGQGVVTTYCHLSSIGVEPGRKIRKGMELGRSGSTGRVTGPHLHFGLFVQGVAVDAMPLLSSPPAVVGGPSKTLSSDRQRKTATRKKQ